jgi:hypothetical protein
MTTNNMNKKIMARFGLQNQRQSRDKNGQKFVAAPHLALPEKKS